MKDVVDGIVQLPLVLRERMGLLREFYDATNTVENGMCYIEGPFRQKLHGFFSKRHSQLRDRRQLMERSRRRTELEARELDKKPLTMHEEEELARIVAETRGNFDDLDHALAQFAKQLEGEVESDVRTHSDAAEIQEARNTLREPKHQQKSHNKKADEAPDYSIPI